MVAGSELVLVSTCEMLFPVPSVKPEAVPLVSTAVQVNDVPKVLLVNEIPVLCPEQRV
jgi:hypothetical protein